MLLSVLFMTSSLLQPEIKKKKSIGRKLEKPFSISLNIKFFNLIFFKSLLPLILSSLETENSLSYYFLL